MTLYLEFSNKAAIRTLINDHPEAAPIVDQFADGRARVVVELQTDAGRFRLLNASEVAEVRARELEQEDAEVRGAFKRGGFE